MDRGLDYIPLGIVCPEKGHKLEKLHINKWEEAETEKEKERRREEGNKEELISRSKRISVRNT